MLDARPRLDRELPTPPYRNLGVRVAEAGTCLRPTTLPRSRRPTGSARLVDCPTAPTIRSQWTTQAARLVLATWTSKTCNADPQPTPIPTWPSRDWCQGGLSVCHVYGPQLCQGRGGRRAVPRLVDCPTAPTIRSPWTTQAARLVLATWTSKTCNAGPQPTPSPTWPSRDWRQGGLSVCHVYGPQLCQGRGGDGSSTCPTTPKILQRTTKRRELVLQRDVEDVQRRPTAGADSDAAGAQV
jgi:hypothetical protein